MYNPRWPHTFRVVVEPLDANGLPVTDANGDPVVGSMQLEKIVYDSAWNPTRNPDGSFVTEMVTDMPWGYRTSTGGLHTSGDVIVADYKVSVPMMLTELPSGTILQMTDYTHTFRAKLLKMTTYNWGTNMWLDNIKN
jgi:hypothetical protein